MSRYTANIITKSPVTPTGPTTTGRAPGIWRLDDVAYWTRQGLWPNPSIQAPDTYFPYVSLLLSTTSLGNASNNLFVDSSGAFNPVSRNGNTTQGSFTPYSTNWSNSFVRSPSSYLTVPNPASQFAFGTGDFTVEAWVYLNTMPSGNGYDASYWIVGGGPVNSNTGFDIAIGSTNLQVGLSSFASLNINTAHNMVVGTWYHVAVVRSGSTLYAFINGAQLTSVSVSGVTADPCLTGLAISAAEPTGATSGNFNGYISNLRIVKGTAVYTSAFTPPTSALTAISGTSLLTCQSNRFRDASTNNLTLTVTGNTSVQDFGPFSPAYPGASYNQSDITNWSGYLNGSSYWTVPTSTALDVWDNGSGSFTVEAWIFATASIPNNTSVIAKATNDGNPSWTNGWAFQVYNGYLNVNTPGDSRLFNSNTTSVPLNQWVHCALVKSGSTVSIYQNGVRVGTTTNSTAYSNTTDAVAIGVDRNLSGGGKLTGYVSNARMVKGTAVYNPSLSTLTVPTTNLTAVSGTSLLTLQSAAFTDNSGNNYLVNSSGTPTVTGNSPFNTVGYWSNYFDGTGDYLTAPYTTANFDWYTAGTDYTIEAWFFATTLTNTSYPNGGTQAPVMCGNRDPNAGTDYWSFGPTSEGIVAFYYYNGSAQRVASTTTISAGRWNHVAMTKTSSGITLFVNGTAQTTVAISGTPQSSASFPFAIGQGGSSAYSFPGYISNLRVVRGTAIYSGNFTPPTSPLTAVTNTKLLTCQNGRFIDNSTNALTITPAGNVAAQSFDPFYTATIASNGGSIYFDGSGDYLAVPSATNMNFGTGNWTVECWVYVSTRTTNYPLIFGNNRGSFTTDALAITASNADSSPNYIDKFVFAWGSSGFSSPSAGTSFLLVSNVTNSNNTWYHLAVVRNGTSVLMFRNGVQVANATVSSGATFNWNYNGALIGGGNWDGASGYMNGYVSNLRVTSSAVYTTAFTPPTTPLTPSGSTTLLLNGMNAGIYDATTINDMETVGNAQTRNLTPFPPANYYAGYFDGSGDYLATGTSSAIALGTSDFTYECWVYPSSYPNDSTLVYAGGTSTGNEISLQIRNSQVAAHLYISGVHSDVQFTDLAPALNQWSHVAISRVSGVLYGFLNGVRSATAPALTANFGTSAAAYVAIGNRYAGSISNARITKNVAVYSTATYTVPTSPLEASANTAFLTCQNKTFIDNSPNALPITVYGGATAGVSGPFTYTGASSVYFDGSGDYLVSRGNTILLGSGNFTVEFWVYFNAVNNSTVKYLYDFRTASATSASFLAQEASNAWTYWNGAGSSVTTGLSGSTFATGQWYHVAITRSSNVLYCFVNGTKVSSDPADSSNYASATMTLGARYSGSDGLNGYIDDVRLTAGVARYTSNFTPPTQAFPTY